MESAIGIDIGGTKCAVCFGQQINGSVKIIEKNSFKTEGSWEDVLQQLLVLARDCLEKYGNGYGELAGVGISCGGPLDSKKGLLLSPPNLKGWNNVPVKEFFETRLHTDVRLMNDADACAVAEWKFGAGKGLDNVIFLTFGTGMGAGLILNGRLYSGTSDTAGECGHIRLESFGPAGYGKAGSFEGFCSGGGLAQIGQMLIREKLQMGESVPYCKSYEQLSDINARLLAQQAEAGDKLALQSYRISGEQLGRGLSILVDLLNPQKIILGSIFSRSQNLLWKYTREVMERECLPRALAACEVAASGLGEKIGDYAALSAAFYPE